MVAPPTNWTTRVSKPQAQGGHTKVQGTKPGGNLPEGIPISPSETRPYDVRNIPYLNKSVLIDRAEDNATLNAVSMAYHQSRGNTIGFAWAFLSDSANTAINNKMTNFALDNAKTIGDKTLEAMFTSNYDTLGITYQDLKTFVDAFAKAYKKENMKPYVNRVPTEIVNTNFKKALVNTLPRNEQAIVEEGLRSFALDMIEAVQAGNSRKKEKYGKELNYIDSNRIHDAISRSMAFRAKQALESGELTVDEFREGEVVKYHLAAMFNDMFGAQGLNVGYDMTKEMLKPFSPANEQKFNQAFQQEAERQKQAGEVDAGKRGLLEETAFDLDSPPVAER